MRRKKGSAMGDHTLDLIMLLAVLGVLFWMFFPSFKGLFGKTDYVSCFATQKYDNDPLPDSMDPCPCDPQGMAMVAGVSKKSDLGAKCTGISYTCDKVDGRWDPDKSVCWPTAKVKAGTDAGCGQAKNIADVTPASVPLSKMDVDTGGAPLEYCPTDKDVCQALIEKSCDVAKQKEKESGAGYT